MKTIAEQGGSELFLVRVWLAQDSKGETEWAGKLQHVVSGKAAPFRGRPELIEVLLAMLPSAGSDDPEGSER